MGVVAGRHHPRFTKGGTVVRIWNTQHTSLRMTVGGQVLQFDGRKRRVGETGLVWQGCVDVDEATAKAVMAVKHPHLEVEYLVTASAPAIPAPVTQATETITEADAKALDAVPAVKRARKPKGE